MAYLLVVSKLSQIVEEIKMIGFEIKDTLGKVYQAHHLSTGRIGSIDSVAGMVKELAIGFDKIPVILNQTYSSYIPHIA